MSNDQTAHMEQFDEKQTNEKQHSSLRIAASQDVDIEEGDESRPLQQSSPNQALNGILHGEASPRKDRIIARLRELSITQLLWYFALPAMIANAISAVTNSTETTIQKRIIGDVGISSTSIIQPLELMLTIYISLGLSGGVVSFISPALGHNDMKTAQKYLMHFMVWYLFVICFVPLITLPWIDDLVVQLGAPRGSDMAKYAKQYGIVMFSCGTIFYFINYGYGNILRATSRSLFNALKQIITACIQLLFVYITYTFIVAKGHIQMYTNAACPIAANMLCAVVVSSLFIPFKKLFRSFKLKFSKSGLRPFDWLAMFEIAYYAIPDWLAQFQIPIIVMVGNSILSRLSKSYIEAQSYITVLGIVYKMSPLIAISNQTFSYAFGPVFGFQLGAHHWKRCRQAMMQTFLWQSGLSLLFWLVMNVSVESFSLALMQGYKPMADDVSFGFRCYNMMMPYMSCFLCSNDINQCEQKPLKAFLVQVSRLFFVVIFEIIFSAVWKDQRAIYYAFIAADFVSGTIGIVNFFERYYRYGQLERGEIDVIKAGIGEVTGEKKRCWRISQKKRVVDISTVQSKQPTPTEEVSE